MKAQLAAITATNRPGDAEAFADLADVLVVLEDFLLHAGTHIVDELAAYPLTRPDDPHGWAMWVAGLLGEHVITLRALIPTNQALPAHQPIGEPR